MQVLKSGQAPAKSDAWTEPLIVRVKDAGPYQIPKLFVNSKEVAWEDLEKPSSKNLGRVEIGWSMLVETTRPVSGTSRT